MKIDFTQQEIDLLLKVISAQVNAVCWTEIVCGMEYDDVSSGIDALEALYTKVSEGGGKDSGTYAV